MASPSGRVTRARAMSTQSMPVVSSRNSDTYGSHNSPESEGSQARHSELGQPGGGEVSRTRSGRPRQSVAPSPSRATKGGTRRQLRIPVGTAATFAAVQEEEDEDEDDDEDDDDHEEEEVVVAEPVQPAEQPAQGAAAQQVHDTYLSATGVAYDEARPWQATVFSHSFLRFLERMLNNIGLAVTSAKGLIVFLLLLSALVTFFSVPTLPAGWAAQRARMIKGGRLIVGLSEYERPPAGIEKEWIFFKHLKEFHEGDLPDYNVPDLQWTININFARRLKDLEVKTDQLANALEGVQSTIADLLPRLVVVDVVDNHLHITEEFYAALRSKLDGDSTIWAAFWRKPESNR
ncbi:hypothetical protein AMS68_005232 [Peltaster fructicola]|uniref:Uncharacterized protein n=1 Tax=Peltaster fructicola TaxID=286661 RepID=A0A6H0XYH6_9PEZI|nr:hypothetical protein AMS68_005232 [Peltaster fructicola]